MKNYIYQKKNLQKRKFYKLNVQKKDMNNFQKRKKRYKRKTQKISMNYKI